MALDEDLSKMKDQILTILPDIDCYVTKDRLNFFVWELNFLDIFLCLQSFTFTGECCMLHVIQKMQEIWKRLYAIIYGPDPGAYFNEFLTTSRRDEFIDSNTDPFTFHVPTEVWKIKLEFRAKYSFPKISSISLPANKDDDFPTPKFVMEFIDDVLKILGDLVKIDNPCSLLYVRGLKEQIEDVFKELKLLRLFVCFVSNKCIEPQSKQSFFTHALIEAVHTAMVTWLYLPIHGNENQDLAPNEVNVLFSDLLKMKIKPIRPGIHKIYIDVLLALKSTIQPAGLHPNKHVADRGIVENRTHNLVELPTVSSPSQNVALDDQMAILQEMLALLRDKIIHLATLDHGFHLQDMDTVIVDAGFLIYSLYDSKEEKDDTTLEDVNRALGHDLPSNIQPIKAMIYLIIQKAVSHFNLPTIHGLGYVDFLLNNLKEFQSRYANSLVCVNDQLQIIQKKLESLQPFLKVVAQEQHSKFETLQDCVTQLISKAYQVEYVLDACINKDIPHWCLERFLLDIIEEITRIKAKIQEKDMVEDTMKTGTALTSSQLTRIPRMNEEIVGFEDVIENLRNQLLKGIKGQDVISVHGMPGQGKTTLAYRLYSDRSVVSQFDIRAQCCVSQVYSYKDLLLSLLRDAIGEDSQRREKGADELADMLRKTLLPKRYLILVDDLWENSAWDDLRGCFPDANNRSRIILTTRHLEVAEYASIHSVPLHLRMFTDDESWKLLEKEVFGEESCSPHLIDVGKRIAKMCAQLPLSIALVAGILKETEKNEESWEKMAENLGSHIHGDSKGIIEQSYQNLPYHLRSCFLYFGAFLEDKVIKTSKLTRLWISEGFVVSCGGKRLEDIAEGYLENLIGRNLVMVAQKSNSDGKIKECHLHDVLLDFCKERASEENLLLWIKCDQVYKLYLRFNDMVLLIDIFDRDQSANPFSCVYSHKQHAQRRLAFSEVDNLVDWSSSCSLVGSVLFKDDAADLYTRDLSARALAISRILQNFRFLKVLDLEHYVVIDSFPSDLIYLRYFSAQIDQTSIPSSISKLRNLETLLLKCRKREYTTLLLPITVWEMVKLRHLHISEFDIDEEELHENSAELYDLETFSAPYFSSVENAELMLRKTPNLRKLRCKVEGDLCYEYHILDFPTRLEILQIYKVRYSSENIPFCISAPNLKSLTISGFRLDPQNLSAIAQLQNLQVLKLYYARFGYPSEWKVSNGEFPQLKVLKLQRHCPLEEWTVADDAFPNLEQLFLDNCRSLKEIPSSFGDISSLKYIEVRECNESVAKSAREIRETQVEDYQNADFKLFIVEE